MIPVMTTIKLSGPLRKAFGEQHLRLLDTGTAREVFKSLTVSLPGFAEEVRRLAKLGMEFAIYRNGENVAESEFDRGGTKTLRIVPVLSGSKRSGVLQTVVGAVLIVVGAVLTYFGFGAVGIPMMKLGAAVAVGGVIQMLSPQASGLSQSASPENLPSYAFGSAKNTTASGNPVPICIGERRWGGAIISASIYAEDKV